MKNFFKLSELSKDTLVGRDIGAQTRCKIKNLLEVNESITIDMENNSKISPSFLDEAIIALVVEYGKENFNKLIKLKNIHSGIRILMNSILSDKKNI